MTSTAIASWLSLPRVRKQARVRLFCFPYAGGGASAFREWVDVLPDFIELVLVQLPGRETRFRETPSRDIPELVSAIADAALCLPQLPYATFGHSLGTLLSYEFALEMRRRSESEPIHAVMSGRGAPHLARSRTQTHRLPDDEFINALREMQGTPEEVLRDRDLMQLLLPTLRADFALAEDYSCPVVKVLPCGISVYGGLADIGVRREQLQEWQAYSDRPIVLRLFPGGHFFLHSARYSLLQALARDLSAACDPRVQVARSNA